MIDGLRAAIRRPLRAAGSLAWTAGMVSAAELHKRTVAPDERDQLFDRWERRWARGLLELMGGDLTIVPGSPPPRTRGRLVVSNHRSALDVPALLSQFGGSAVSREDLAGWPVIGMAARSAQSIFVDRDSPSSGAKAIRAMRLHLRNARSVCVFPEGTTFEGDDVRPFQAGAFAAAARLDVELVPVGLAYPRGTEFIEESFLDHAKAIAGRRRTAIVMVIGDGQTAGRSAAAMATSMRDAVQDLVRRARSIAEGRTS